MLKNFILSKRAGGGYCLCSRKAGYIGSGGIGGNNVECGGDTIGVESRVAVLIDWPSDEMGGRVSEMSRNRTPKEY